MPNRRGSGNMPTRHHQSNTAKKRAAAKDSRTTQEKSRPRGPSRINRPDLVGAGDFGKDYQQWSKGDLYNRARQLEVTGRSGMTKADLVKALKKAEKTSR